MNEKKLKIAFIDNYDSFVHTIVHYITFQNNCEIILMKNDEIEDEIIKKCDALVLSPGPGLPKESGKLIAVIEKYYTSKPILGICLGLQAIYEFFGGKLKNLPQPLHGYQGQLSLIKTHEIFNEITFPTPIGHYHSWVANTDYLPAELEILAVDNFNNIIAIQHTQYPIVAVQFHPESILTTNGLQMMKNWINMLH